MDYSRLLLLLMGVIFSHLPKVSTKSIDFWCKNDTRERMLEMIEDKVECVGSDDLQSPLQLPCVGVNAVEWANKTLQQKHAEVLAALRLLQTGVQHVRSQPLTQCQTSVLKRLERSITNHLVIVTSLHIQMDRVPPALSAGQNCSSETSLTKVLTEVRRLLSGKLERLAEDIQDRIC